MSSTEQPRSRDDFEIAIICALPCEAEAVEEMFDVFWEGHASLGKANGDPNAYTTGRIGEHNVVLAHMPSMGKGASASLAASFRSSFNNIRLGLVVGICGGVPYTQENEEIILGDVIVSTRVVQFDFGRQYSDGFVLKDAPGDAQSRPNREISAFLHRMNSSRRKQILQDNSLSYLKALFNRLDDEDLNKWGYPGLGEDILFSPSYRHKHRPPSTCRTCAKCKSRKHEICENAIQASCANLGCDGNAQVKRNRIERLKQQDPQLTPIPRIYQGPVASGDTVMKSAYHRDKIAQKSNVIAFEMEGAGVWDNFPTLVIKGVCDYADSHKHKKWQNYAAIVAASCMKAFLKEWRGIDRPSRPMDSRTHSGPSPSTNNTHFMVPRAPNALFAGREGVIKRIIQSLSPSNQLNKQKRFVITGLGGQGKSELSIKIADLLREEYWGIFWIDVDNELSAKQGFLAVAKQLNPVAESVADALLALTNVKNHWLLILDNADDPDFDYQAYFPSGTYGSILMTSRVTECSRFNTVGSIALAGLQLDQCIPLLLNAAELPQDQWSSHYRDAKDIVQHLGSHTLAIIQAGAYLARGFCKFNEYIQDFQRQRGLLLKYRQRQATSRYGDVYATFEASAARLEQMGTDASRDALELLNIISVLHYTPLSIELFDKAWECTHKLLVMGILNSRASPEAFEDDDDAQYIKSFWHFPGQLKKKESLDKWHFLHLPEFINNGDEDYKPRRLLNAISLLDSLSLIKNNHFLSVSMHPLAHAWAKDRQSRQSQFKSWMTAGCILAVSTTNSQLESFWETRGDQLVTHLSSYLDSNTDNQISSQSAPRVIPILLQCGRALDLMDDYNGLEQVCRTLQNQHGIDPSHSSVDFVEVYELIASMYMNQHRSVKAIHALKVILHLRTTVYNNTGYTLLYSVSKLASALRRKGDFSEAIALLDYYIAQSKTRLPATDPNLLRLQSVLATLYERTGQASKAIKLLKKVIAIQTTIFTFDDPILFESQHNLAIAYYQDTQFTKAIKLLEYLTTVQMPIFREDHPSRLLTEKMLAKAYLITGRFESALKILERVVLMQERTLSVHHPNLLGSQHALAKAYLETGQVLIAIQILEIVVAMRRKIYREDNPERLASQIYLARAYGRDGQIKRAVKLLKQLAHIRATEETALLDYDDQLSAAEELTYWSKQLERRSSVEDLVYRSGQLELDSD